MSAFSDLSWLSRWLVRPPSIRTITDAMPSCWLATIRSALSARTSALRVAAVPVVSRLQTVRAGATLFRRFLYAFIGVLLALLLFGNAPTGLRVGVARLTAPFYTPTLTEL